MPLNPAFASPSTRPLPLGFGFVLGIGDEALSVVLAPSTALPQGVQQAAYLLGEGEWDDWVYFAPQSQSHLGNGWVGDGIPADQYHAGEPYLNFHGGRYTIKGAGNQLISKGPDQQYDVQFAYFPSPTPPQSFSGIAYALAHMPMDVSFKFGQATPFPLAPMGVWRSLRCRFFDDQGNVTGYGFTTNPAWHFVEAILRRKIKPQQPGLAGLTDTEKACFNWPSITDTAARNAFLLPNGRPRFMGNYVFAAETTLTNILETILRVSRSYQRVQNGQIYLIGDDPRPSTFLLGANHVVPGTMKLSKKDVSKSGNIFIPSYRDIDIPAVCQVLTAKAETVYLNGVPVVYMVFTLNSLSPFQANDFATYGASSDPSFDGTYRVVAPLANLGSGIPDDTPNMVRCAPAGRSSGQATGGFLGTKDARFSQRAPTNVQHRSHQKMVAMQAPGLSNQPRLTEVRYDCGNSTFDQTNRLMRFERDRSLGTDIGADWKAPIGGTLTARLEAVDANGKALIDQQTHDVITLDDWVYPENPGDYEILSRQILPANEQQDGRIVLEIVQYNRNAYTDVSDDPGQSYATVPDGGDFVFGDFPLQTPAWVLQATPQGTLDPVSGLLTVKTPDLSVQWVGQIAPTLYPAAQWTGLTPGNSYVLYLDDPAMNGAAIYGFQAGSLPLANDPPGRVVVLYGVFNANSSATIDLAVGSAAFFTGSVNDQTVFSLPSSPAANAENLMDWVSPRGYIPPGVHLHYIQICGTDLTRMAQLVYNDSAGSTWGGPLNFAGVTWSDGASVSQSASGLMSFVELTLAGGEKICFGKGTVPSSSAIALPSGYSLAQSIMLAFPSSAADSGHPAHGVRAYVDSTGHAHHDYSDGSGNNWSGPAMVLFFGWKNNVGTVVSTGGWIKIPLSTGRTFAAGGFSIVDSRAGSPPPNYPTDNLYHVTSGGKLPLPSGLTADYLQTIPCPNSFQITGNDAHGINECLVDSSQTVKTSFQDGEGHVWFGSSEVFALLVE